MSGLLPWLRITSGPCIGSRQKNTGYDGSNMSASDTIMEQKLAITHPIQPHKVIIPFSSIELNGKPSGISSQVWKLSTKCDSRVANEDRGPGLDAVQELCL